MHRATRPWSHPLPWQGCQTAPRRLNLLPAQKLADYRHFELEHETEKGHLLACLDYVADDWQIERGQQVARLVEDKRGSGEVCPLATLRDHGQARLVGRCGRCRGGGPPGEQQAGNVGYQSLFGPNEKGNLASQLGAQFARSV